MKFIKKYLFAITGLMIGATGGFLYYYYYGCESGTCMITANPYISTVYGAIFGTLFFNSFKK
jgi:hypothetical protein